MDFSLITNEPLDYCVYVHINKNDGKIYIGITNNVQHRWAVCGENYVGCTHFYNALQKYGWSNFYHIVVVDNIPFSVACEIEKYLIQKYNTIYDGYNLRAGGEGGGALRDKHHKSKPIYQYDFDGNFIKKWDCPIAAPSLFAVVLIPDPEVIPEWVQPDSTNPYMTGDKVAHNGQTWISTVDNNVWEPGVYGWEVVE